MKKLFLLMIVTAVGCDLFDPSGEVSASVEGSRLVVTNHSFSQIYYAAFERSSLASINWAAVCSPENEILPLSSATIAIAESSFRPSNEAVVYWWHRGKKYEGCDLYGPDEIRSIVLKVR